MAPWSEDPKLIIRAITLELVQPICPGYINVTDGRTDGRTTYDNNTALALRASRGNIRSVENFYNFRTLITASSYKSYSDTYNFVYSLFIVMLNTDYTCTVQRLTNGEDLNFAEIHCVVD